MNSSKLRPAQGTHTLTTSDNDTRRSAIRSVATILARYEMRKLKRLLSDFDNDILLPLLLGEIALHNVGVLENGGELRSRQGARADADGESWLRPCNAYSIAAATGLPRETVRRKIGRLVEQGWVEKCENGHLYMADRTVEHFSKLLQSRDLPELLETAARVRKLLERVAGDEH